MISLRFSAMVGAATLLVHEADPTDWLTPGFLHFLDRLGLVGVVVLVGLSVITGKGGLALMRELKDAKAQIAALTEANRWLRMSNEGKDETIRILTGAARVSATAFDKVTTAAVAAGGTAGSDGQ